MRKAVPEACLLLLLPQSYGPRFRGRSRSYLITLGLQLFLPQLWPQPGLLSPIWGWGTGGGFICPGGQAERQGDKAWLASFPDGLTYGVEGATKRSVLLPSSQGLSGPLPPLVRPAPVQARQRPAQAIPVPPRPPGPGGTRTTSEEGGELPVSSGSGTPAPPAPLGQAGLSGHGLCERA